MHNLTNIRVTADKFLDLWVVRVFWNVDPPSPERLIDFHRLDMRDWPDVEDPFDLWMNIADGLTESLVVRRRWESGLSPSDRPPSGDA
jgi:hypothetical protein